MLKKILNELIKLKNIIYHKFYVSSKTETEIINNFHKLYYDSRLFGKTWNNTFWLGTKILKCPFDLWVYQEIIYNLKPDIIIECGTAYGGGAYYLATICDLVNKGEIITIDIEHKENRPQHKRIKYLSGSSTEKNIIEQVKNLIKNKNTILVILDSDHSKEHVLNELEIYSKFVSINSYIIVEDSNVNGHPVYPEFGHGPMEAINDFLEVNKNFIIDKEKEKFYLTFNPNGFLKRIK